MEISTLCVHGSVDNTNQTGAVSTPIFQTATFSHQGTNEKESYDYSRLQNPTRQQLENILTNLENGVDSMAFSTGMAAITAVTELLNTGDHILVSADLYGGTYRLFSHLSKKSKLEFDFINTWDKIKLEEAVKENTKMIFIETPTNPMMKVVDIEWISKVIKDKDIILVVDNTLLTPYFQNPLNLGADIVVHSGTKYLAGHNDTLSGFLVTNNEKIAESLRYIYKTTGACLSPFDSWLTIRGIKTLAIRMETQQKNALEIAKWLKGQDEILEVYYIGLKDSCGYNISIKQSRGFGAVISFRVDNKERASNILNKVKLITYAESLGGVETLITYPMLQTHGDIPKEFRDILGVDDRLLRLSVGIEDYNDIIEDLKNAIED